MTEANTESGATATKKAVKKSPTKKASTKKVLKKNSPEVRSKNAALARQVIKKKTGQSSTTANYSTYPHVSSESYAIDDLIGGSKTLDGKGRVCPGYPRRRLTEIFGSESSGKTTVALHACAGVQRSGGLAMYLDFEHALDHKYAKSVGLSFDEDKLLLYAPDTMEEGFQIINIGLQAGVDIIVVDSVPSMVPREDMEGKLDEEGRFGNLARGLAKNLPKLVSWLNQEKFLVRNPEGTAVIFLNQQRANIGGGMTNPTKTTGGYAMKFYTSLRLQLTGTKKEYARKKSKFTGAEVSTPYGTHTKIKVVKNKIDAKQGASHMIFIRYGIGIDEVYSLIEAACHLKVVQKSGSSYTWGGTTVVGREKFREFIIKNPKVFEEIRSILLSLVQGESSDSEQEEELTEAEVMARNFEEEFDEEEPRGPSEVDVEVGEDSESSESEDG